MSDSAKGINVLISKQEAIKALGEEPLVWDEWKDQYELGQRFQWQCDRAAIMAVPAVPQGYSMDEWCTDCKEYDQEKHVGDGGGHSV